MTTSIIQISLAFFIGLIIVFYAIPVIVRISIAKHLYDVPNERKVNKTVIPNLGGVALFIGISIGTMIGILKNAFPDWRFISSGMIILFFIGLKDDVLVISARKKFAAQFLSAFILILLGDIRLTSLHGILGINEISYSLSVFVSLLAIVGTINAINLIDGIDGLAASIGIFSSLILGVIFLNTDQINYAVLCFATVGSLISFLMYNVFGTSNKIFMGDTGALLLGLLLSVFVIKYNEISNTLGDEARNFSPIFSLAILAVPLFDMVRLFTVRIIKKKSPFAADINHIHHKLLRIGLSHQASTFFITLANLIIIGIIYITGNLNNHFSLLILISTIVIFWLIPGFIYEYKKTRNRYLHHINFRHETDSKFNRSELLTTELSGKKKVGKKNQLSKPNISVHR